jgi:hypothetical protein
MLSVDIKGCTVEQHGAYRREQNDCEYDEESAAEDAGAALSVQQRLLKHYEK